MEGKSATTYENSKNVRDMPDVGKRSRYLFVTNDYHVFRTGLFANKLRMDSVVKPLNIIGRAPSSESM